MKVICKVPVLFKFLPNDKRWTKGKQYTATETGYKTYSVRNNSGVAENFSEMDLKKYFDIIDG
jgi:hypothetical protein